MCCNGEVICVVGIYRADLACDIALEATATVSVEQNGRREIDIKRYAKVEKVHSLSLASKITLALCNVVFHGQLNLVLFLESCDQV